MKLQSCVRKTRLMKLRTERKDVIVAEKKFVLTRIFNILAVVLLVIVFGIAFYRPRKK